MYLGYWCKWNKFLHLFQTKIVMKILQNSLAEIFGWFSDSRLATLLKSSPWKNFFWKYFKLSMTGACSWWSYSILTKSKILVLHQNFDHWVWWHHHWSFSSSVVQNIWSWKVASCIVLRLWITARKVSKYGVFSGPYFPVFGMNTGQYGPEKTPYLDIFRAVYRTFKGTFKILSQGKK